jgi:hypothetical protein
VHVSGSEFTENFALLGAGRSTCLFFLKMVVFIFLIWNRSAMNFIAEQLHGKCVEGKKHKNL